MEPQDASGSVLFDPSRRADVNLVEGDGQIRLVFRLRLRQPGVTPRVEWRQAGWTTLSMEDVGLLGEWAVFQAVIHVQDPARPVVYRFCLSGPEGERFFGPAGLAPEPEAAGSFQLHPGTQASFPVVAWTRGRVFYQVFPDRFANGDPSNDPPGTTPWGGAVRPDTGSQYFGGDLAGLIDRLDYLQDLGVGGLYLNPIFSAGSSHGYDTVDYLRIDPRLGDLDTFRTLLDEAHRREMRVILDAVFNHTGTGFWAFQDVAERGAASRYKDWYHFHGFPVNVEVPNYEAWWNVPSLPKLRVSNPDVRAYLMGVARYWTRLGIDGWRLDVPNEIREPGFWEEFRLVVKGINPEAYIVGEIWHVEPEWLEGTCFDAVMNYPLGRDALVPFFRGKGGFGARELDRAVQRAVLAYPEQAVTMNFNVVGSHDTARVLTALGGGNLGVEPDPGAVRRLKALMSFLFALPGVPVIYYGDERGMLGEKGEDWDAQRAPMPWDEGAVRAGAEIFDHLRKLVRLRRQHPALVGPVVTRLALDDAQGLYACARGGGGEEVVAVTTREARRVHVVLAGLTGRFRDLVRDESLHAGGQGLNVELDGPETRLIVKES
ncbi:glycoside hydrolase family 13 protein [Limnochorda pilosa]|uniref:Alpha-amylase n=1 Tax=Limnochorda pilosa TaxID=1555112 RepID=A0A0K2SFX2_LIMPI|nr:glycoside hydrolase family 13 protein [Limnochorda pilosa]BAS26003.1 alpha-amylase [Limnochorda pilosa]